MLHILQAQAHMFSPLWSLLFSQPGVLSFSFKLSTELWPFQMALVTFCLVLWIWCLCNPWYMFYVCILSVSDQELYHIHLCVPLQTKNREDIIKRALFLHLYHLPVYSFHLSMIHPCIYLASYQLEGRTQKNNYM